MSKSEPKHLLILVEGFYPQTGGGAQSQWEIAKTAGENNHRVSVFTPKLDETPRHEVTDGVEIHRLFPGAPDRNNPNSPRGMAARILHNIILLSYLFIWSFQESPDVIYSPSHLMHPLAKVLSIIYNIPVINFIAYSPVLEKDQISWYDPRRIMEYMNFRYCLGDTVFSQTIRVREMIEDLSDSRVIQAHGIINEEDLRDVAQDLQQEEILSNYHIPKSATVLCWVGRGVPIKRPQVAVQILEDLPQRYHLIMVGDGPEIKKIRKHENSSSFKRVHFTGLVPHKNALRIIGVSDGLLLTSETESYPTVVFEALALQTSVFATPVGILPSLSEDRLHTGEPQDLVSLIENTELEWTPRTNIDVINRYSINRLAEDIITQIKAVSS